MAGMAQAGLPAFQDVCDGATQALIEHCRSNLTAYKVPRQVQFVGELPKSLVGKILRRELRA